MKQDIKTDIGDEPIDDPDSINGSNKSKRKFSHEYNSERNMMVSSVEYYEDNAIKQPASVYPAGQGIYDTTQSVKVSYRKNVIKWLRLWHGKWKALFDVKKKSHTLRVNLEHQLSQSEEDADTSLSIPERSILRNVIDFGDMRVCDVMVPRADIISVEYGSKLTMCLRLFRSSGYSRLLVYKKILDTPIGMLHIKDILNFITQGETTKHSQIENDSSMSIGISSIDGTENKIPFSISKRQLQKTIEKSSLLRNVLFVPSSMTAANLLLLMQRSHTHMAVVVDEYGGTDGIVTMENLVDEIIGGVVETGQEHDNGVKDVGEKEFIMSARVPLEAFEGIIGKGSFMDDLDEEIDTLGGMVSSIAGRVPTRGEIITHPTGIEFTILEADPRKIKKLKVKNI